jgi:hypothetical protein
MKSNLHQQTQEWLLTGTRPEHSDHRNMLTHLESCKKCGQLAIQVQQLQEILINEIKTPDFSTPSLKQKSIEVRAKFDRRRMKNLKLNVLRFAGVTTLVLAFLFVGLMSRSWFDSSLGTHLQATDTEEAIKSTSAGTTTIFTPMKLDPALCTGQSKSPYMPKGDIAIDGGRVISGNVTFEFWLTCSNSTENYTPSTRPIERLGLYAFWIYQQPVEGSISDFYGFEPRSYVVMLKNPISDGVTTSSGASGIISIAETGEEIPQGLFVLPDPVKPAKFITRLETDQGTYSAAITFRLQASENGYQPVDVSVVELPFIPPSDESSTDPIRYPQPDKLIGPGACTLETDQPVVSGSGKLIWPFEPEGVEQEKPGIYIYSKEKSTAIMAADSGTVIFSGINSTDGKISLVIDHGKGYLTLYSHLGWVDVACGQVVEKGQPVARTWDSTEGDVHSYIYFALYNQGIPQNPLKYLPPSVP